MQFGGSTQESASAAAVIVALWLSESASRFGFSFSAPKCEFIRPTRRKKHNERTSEDSGLRMAKKTVAVEVKCAEETTSRHLHVQRIWWAPRERRALEGKNANGPATARASPARAEVDFGIGIVGRQEAASFLHSLEVNIWEINLCISMRWPITFNMNLWTLWFTKGAFFSSRRSDLRD